MNSQFDERIHKIKENTLYELGTIISQHFCWPV